MRTTRNTLMGFSLAVLLCTSSAGILQAQDRPVQPDNTKVNKRDRNSGEPTADQQKANTGDRDLSARIRRAVVDDKSLSSYAHNVKIISQNGVVTLKGPVRSEEEAKAIMAKATEVAGGADKVVNQMTVKPSSNH